ncbi:MAG: metal-dependent hydrolase [Desulfovibrionaceae bacterium]
MIAATPAGKRTEKLFLTMPGYKGHIAGSLAVAGAGIFGLAFAGIYQPEPFTGGALVVACVLGALFPDVDTDSKGQNVFYSMMLLVDVALILLEHYKWAAFLGAFAMLPGIGPHRGWTHTWWAMILVPLPILVIPYFLLELAWHTYLPFYLAFSAGYFSHLALDRKF